MKKSTKILKEGEQQEPRKFSNEVKKHFLEIVSTALFVLSKGQNIQSIPYKTMRN